MPNTLNRIIFQPVAILAFIISSNLSASDEALESVEKKWVVANYPITSNVTCSISEIYNLWPINQCRVSIIIDDKIDLVYDSFDNTRMYDKLNSAIGYINIGNDSIKPMPIFYTTNVGISFNYSNYKTTIDEPEININDKHYKLTGFNEYIATEATFLQNNLKKKLTKERLNAVGKYLIIITVILTSIWLSFLILRKTFRVSSRYLNFLKERITSAYKKMRNKNELRRVKNTTIDAAVALLVKDSLHEFTPEQVDDLKREIANSLNNGEVNFAKKLEQSINSTIQKKNNDDI